MNRRLETTDDRYQRRTHIGTVPSPYRIEPLHSNKPTERTLRLFTNVFGEGEQPVTTTDHPRFLSKTRLNSSRIRNAATNPLAFSGLGLPAPNAIRTDSVDVRSDRVGIGVGQVVQTLDARRGEFFDGLCADAVQ